MQKLETDTMYRMGVFLLVLQEDGTLSIIVDSPKGVLYVRPRADNSILLKDGK